ncbi:hypothetical protein MED121_03482 [Marinomonas sp. MED121]|uniref:hypothetical protein n=1 Tax=Marinomonas sp. MED121 TaxID=314277 RepID=UPI000068FD2E|nr:hypothetical protein [Marinomonas sp. MED121]EAQ63727.1 hypothetical protein MED121_03482 [Marinomonas sp. MED121]
MNQVKWGILQGFNPKSNSIKKWTNPNCESCKGALTPWVDWCSFSGCIGYCSNCSFFYFVKSRLIPASGIHSRAEVSELVGHDVVKVFQNLVDVRFAKEIWELHKKVSITFQDSNKVFDWINNLEEKIEYAVLLKHMLWTLIWNAKEKSFNHLRAYLNFVYEHPHYVKLGVHSVWVGHEADISREIEATFGCHVVEVLYELYERENLTPSEFNSRLGFYIPQNNEYLEPFGKVFTDYAVKSRR